MYLFINYFFMFLSSLVEKMLRAQTQALQLEFLMLRLLSSHPKETSLVIFSILI